MHRYLASLVSAVGLGTLFIGVASEAPERAPARKVDFNRDVLPILSEHCFRCHGPDSGSVAAGLRLDMFETATAAASAARARPFSTVGRTRRTTPMRSSMQTTSRRASAGFSEAPCIST